MVEAGEARGSPTKFLIVGAEGQVYFIREAPDRRATIREEDQPVTLPCRFAMGKQDGRKASDKTIYILRVKGGFNRLGRK
jgi:hypothetical protein